MNAVQNQIAAAIDRSFTSNVERANIVDGLFAIAGALTAIAKAIHKLGTADAATPMGAVEFHSLAVKEAAERISESIDAFTEQSRWIAESVETIWRNK